MIINLHITTYQGISLGAEHYYAELIGEDKTVELQDILTIRQATRLNKKHRASGYNWNMHSPGDKFSGFDTKDDAIKEGIKEWLNHFPDARFLVLGGNYFEPKPLLATVAGNDAALKKAAQKIVDKCEAIGFFNNRKNDELMDLYCTKWDTLLEEAAREMGE